MPNLANAELCVGCTACVSICPMKCLTIKPDDFGFSYPALIDNEKCVDCHLCEKVCPVLNRQDKTLELPKAYAAFSLNKTIQDNSSSGGIFTELSLIVLRQQGIVYGAAYDEDWNVRHIAVDQVEQLNRLQGAKYSESILGTTFIEIQKHLQQGRLVLFSGTPCQVAGLKSFLRIDYDNLLCLDFVCHGIPSPMAWEKYLENRKIIAESRPIKINQRSKDTGWSRYSYSCLIEYENGTRYSECSFNDLFMKLYCNDYISRKSCNTCDFKGYERISDITVGDFWGIWDIDTSMDNGNGTSLVLIHSLKGKDLFSKIEPCIKYRGVRLEEVSRENQSLLYASIGKSERDSILHRINNNEIDELWYLFPATPRTTLSVWQRAVRKFSRVMHKIKGEDKDN